MRAVPGILRAAGRFEGFVHGFLNPAFHVSWEPDINPFKSVVVGIAWRKPEATVPHLVEGLTNPNWQVRAISAHVLGRLTEEERRPGLSALQAVLGDPKLEVSEAAHVALGGEVLRR